MRPLFLLVLLLSPAHAQEPWRATKTSLYQTFTTAIRRYQESKTSLLLAREASLAGRPAEAERLAERSFAVLQSTYPPDHPILLQPLQILTATLLDQKKIGKARATVQKMSAIPLRRPEDRALMDGVAGALLQVEGRYSEAESRYRNAFAAWQEAGKADSDEAATVLSCLGTLYIHAGRYRDAQRALDRAVALLSTPDSAWLDRVKLFNNRAVLHGRQSRWSAAAQDLQAAVSLAAREPALDPVYLATLLTNYAQVLRKLHHTREAREIEARAAALRPASPSTVDVTELAAPRRQFRW